MNGVDTEVKVTRCILKKLIMLFCNERKFICKKKNNNEILKN